MESNIPSFDLSATKDNPKSPLLALPSELRIKIYKELLYSGPFLEKTLCAETRDRLGNEQEADEEKDQKVDDHGEVVHSENADGEDEEAAEASEQHEVEVEIEDEYGDDDHGEVTADWPRSKKDTTRIERGDFARFDHGTTPSDYGFGWLQPSNSCGIDPSILRVNRQIHDEGILFLYMNVSCHFRFDQDLRLWPMQRYLMQEYRRSYAIDGDCSSRRMDCATMCTRHYSTRSDSGNGLNLHCLRWVSNINIDISWGEVLEQGGRYRESDDQYEDDSYLTNEGELLLDILRYLNQIPAPNSPTPKRLHVTLKGLCNDSLAADPEDSDASTWPYSQKPWLMVYSSARGMDQVITLLRSLRIHRGVSVKEELRTLLEERYVERDVDLETLDWIKT